MKETTKRSIFRWIHIVFSSPIIGHVYSPFRELRNYDLDNAQLPFQSAGWLISFRWAFRRYEAS